MATGIDPKVDYVVKRLFGDEDNALLLVDLLNAVLRFLAGRVVTGVTLLNPFMAKDFGEGKIPIYDIRARDDPGRQFLVEMQQLVRPDFAKRLLYYWSNGHAEQLLRGERYEMLLPTYLVCFLNQNLFEDAVWHHTFRVYDNEQGVLLCKDLEIHLIELTKFDVPVEQVQTPLERWCYFFKHGVSLDLDSLPATLDVPVIRQAVEVLMKISQSEIERHRYLERLKGEQDAASAAAYARDARQIGFDEGKEKGVEEGIEKGIEKGKVIGRIQLLQQLLKQPETPSKELGRLLEDDLLRLEDSLKRQLSVPKEVNGTPPTDKT